MAPCASLLFEFNGLGGQVDVRELAHRGFELADRRHRGQHGLDLALVLGAEDFGQNGINNHEMVSIRGEFRILILLC